MKKSLLLLAGLMIFSIGQVQAHPQQQHQKINQKPPIERHHNFNHKHHHAMHHVAPMKPMHQQRRGLLGANVYLGPISLGFNI